MTEFFTAYIYQPFFNILVGIYYWIGEISGQYDMGVAVIIFAIVVQIILLPINLAGDRSAKDKVIISNKIKEIEEKYKHDPVNLKIESKKVLQSNPGAIISELVNIVIQVIIILMLYRIFNTGLEGEDLHLLYGFMPQIPLPINLVFMGKYDLSHTNVTLNIIQSILIFAVEGLHQYFSPAKISRKEFLSLGIFLPIVSFVIFSLLPAGKKLFIITALIFSIFITLIKQALYMYQILFVPKPTSTPSLAEVPPKVDTDENVQSAI